MRKFLLALSLVLATVGSGAAETAEEIVAWHRGYVQLWQDANVDIDAVAAYYAVPSYFVGPDGVAQLVATKEMIRSRMVATVERLKQQKWPRSEVQVKASMLNPGAALIEAEWTNYYTTDGTPPGGCRVRPFYYLAAKTKEGWKVLSSHFGPCKVP
jgi:uncharacterized NTF2-like protein DUF6841